MTDQTTNWRDAVVSGITEALGSLHANDPIGVQAWLGCAMAAARVQELSEREANNAE